MEDDIKHKKADFIRRSTEVREGFSFAQPNQVLQAVRTYCCSVYGAMIWPLFSDMTKQVFNCWSTCVKLAWGVPRATHTYLVDNFLSCGIPSMRSSQLACFWKFLHGVKGSSSLEVRVVANLSAADIRSTTGSNMFGIEKYCKQELSGQSLAAAKSIILEIKASVPGQDMWRFGCLKKFLCERYQLQAELKDTTEIDSLIDSICSS